MGREKRRRGGGCCGRGSNEFSAIQEPYPQGCQVPVNGVLIVKIFERLFEVGFRLWEPHR